MATTTRRASTPAAKTRPTRTRNPRELVNTLKPNQTPEAAVAKLVVAGLGTGGRGSTPPARERLKARPDPREMPIAVDNDENIGR